MRYVAWIGAGALVYSLGGNTPVHRVAYAVLPMMDKARTPVRGMFLVGLALAVLAACGADALFERRISRRVAVPVLIAVGIVFALLNRDLTYPLVMGCVALVAIAVLLFWRGASRAALVLVVALEATTVAGLRVVPLNHSVCAASHARSSRRDRTTAGGAGDGRITADWNDVMFNPGDQHGIDQLQSFVAGVPANMLTLMVTDPHAGELLGVTHTCGKNGVEPVAGAMPRAWAETTCTHARPVKRGAARQRHVVLTATLACPGKVILSDTMYPGWEARIDGRPAPIHEAMGALAQRPGGRGHAPHRDELPARVGAHRRESHCRGFAGLPGAAGGGTGETAPA